MASSKLPFFFCFIVLHLVALTTAQQNTPLLHVCSDKNGNFTRGSPFKVNLDALLPSLFTKTSINYGFVNASYGVNSGRVNTMALCRGDVKPATCRGCINNSTRELRKSCPNQREAIIWYDYCMLRYSNRYFFHNMEFGPYFWTYSMEKASNGRTFNRVLQILLNSLKSKAASGDSILSLQQEMPPRQSLKRYMHLYTVRLIYPSSSAAIASVMQLHCFMSVVMEKKEEELSHPVVTSGTRLVVSINDLTAIEQERRAGYQYC